VKIRASLILLIVGLIILLVNHVFIDWRETTLKTVVKEFDDLFELQKQDLLEWQKDENRLSDFRKRFFCNDELLKWNDHYAFPNVSSEEEVSLISDKSGLFLTILIMEEDCLLVSSFPLSFSYQISNKYLGNSKNKLIHPAVISINEIEGDYQYKDWFYFSIKSPPNRIADFLAIILILAAIVIAYNRIAIKSIRMLLFATTALLAIRFLVLYFDILPFLVRYQLFDELYYHSSWLNPTLGDLLLNCIVVFLIIRVLSRFIHLNKTKWGYILIGLFCSFLVTQVYFVELSILSNSQISLDVGQEIKFDFLRSVSFISILLTALSGVILTNKVLHSLDTRESWIANIIGFFIFPTIVAFFDFQASIPAFFLLIWVIAYASFRLSNVTTFYPLSIIGLSIALAASCSLTVYKVYEEDELEAKKKFANYLIIKRDLPGEYFLGTVLEDILSDTALLENTDYLKENIIDRFSSSYFKKYEITQVDSDYAESVQLIETEYPSIFFIDNEELRGYLCQINEEIFIQLRQKNRTPTAVYPELLTDEKYEASSGNFDYAVFSSGKILYQRSKFGNNEWLKATEMDNTQLFSNGIEVRGNHFYGITYDEGKLILISSGLYSRGKILTNFFFFTLLFSLFFSLYF